MIGRGLLALALVVGIMPAAAFARPADAGGALPDGNRAAIDQDQADGTCAAGEALVVYHASGAAKGATGALSAQSETDPLASAGFGASDTWDFSAADGAAESTGAAADGALSVQSEGTGSALASGSDVRVAFVQRSDMSTADLVASLEALDFVECAQPNYTVEPCLATSPNDPLYTAGLQYSLTSDSAGIGYSAELTADAATTSTVDNIVAVIDTGVDYTNPDLADNMWVNPGNIGVVGEHGYDFENNDDDPMPDVGFGNSHGTHCAGLVAAKTGNGVGVAGAAQHTKIMALKYGGADMTIFDAYEYLLTAKLWGQNVVAVSNSWHIGAYQPVLDYLVNQAGKAGIVSLFSASNAGRDTATTDTGTTVDLQSPYAIIVASSNSDDTLSSFSNYNATAVDVAAPGSAILSTVRTSDTTKGIAQIPYNPDIARLTGKTTFGVIQLGSLVQDGELVDGASITLYHRDAETQQLVPAIAADQQYLSYAAATGADGINKLKFTITGVSKLSDSKLENYRVITSFSSANPFADIAGTPSPADYIYGFTTTRGSAGSEISAALFIKDWTDKDTAATHLDKADFNQSSTGTFLKIDTTSQQIKYTLQAKLMGTASDDTLYAYADEVAFAKAADDPDYAYMSGTSMSTPLLAGCYAELASLYPNYTPLQLRGLICGGTKQLTATNDASGAKKQIASDGRFTFDAALDSSAVNANTWSISTSIWSSTINTITVHGYGLNRATLTVDGAAVASSAITSQTASEITFKADSSLFDGGSHRFDVTDTSTHRTYQAAYAVPEVDAESTQLVSLGTLPSVHESRSDACELVASADRLFYADAEGYGLRSTTDPASGTWTELEDAAGVFDDLPGIYGALIRYAYRDGKLYAFRAASSQTVEDTLDIYCATYDIAKGTWSPARSIGSCALTGVPTTRAYASGGDVCFFITFSASEGYVSRAKDCAMFRMAEGSDTFEQTSVPVDTADNVQGVAGMYKDGSTLRCLVGDGDSNTINTLAYDGTAWTSGGPSPAPPR